MTTTKYALPYPTLATTPVDIPADITALANAIDAVMVGYSQGVFSARPAAGKQGRHYYSTDTDVLYYDDGSNWHSVGANAAGSITTAMLADDSVTAAKIAADAVGSSEIAANAVGSSELADVSVDTAAIIDAAVTNAKLATDSVTAVKIAADAVGASELADNAVDTAAIVALAVTTAKLADDSVTAAKIAADAVGSSEIAADAVGASELADNAVDTNAIVAGAVTLAKMASDSVDSSKIVNGSIAVGDLAFDPATQTELDTIAALRVITEVSGLKIRVGQVSITTDGNAQAVVSFTAFPTSLLGVIAVNGNYLSSGQEFWCDTWLNSTSSFGFRATTGGGNGFASATVTINYIVWGI